MASYDVGATVTVDTGPLRGIPGTVIAFYEERQEYLVRFTGMQQMFFTEDHVVPWSERDGMA